MPACLKETKVSQSHSISHKSAIARKRIFPKRTSASQIPSSFDSSALKENGSPSSNSRSSLMRLKSAQSKSTWVEEFSWSQVSQIAGYWIHWQLFRYLQQDKRNERRNERRMISFLFFFFFAQKSKAVFAPHSSHLHFHRKKVSESLEHHEKIFCRIQRNSLSHSFPNPYSLDPSLLKNPNK